MSSSPSSSFQVYFQDLLDPRVERTRKHPLINIVFLAVCGVLSGAIGVTQLADSRSVQIVALQDLGEIGSR